jgi:uncharacterized protein YecT (DUF1311 family)
MGITRIVTLAALAAILGVGAAGTAAAAPDCTNPSSTPEMNECGALEVKAADARLNATYQRVLKAFSDKEDAQVKSMLVNAQRAWIRFREADCNAVYEKWSGGTIRGVMFTGCMRARAEQRIKELDDFETRG